MPITDVWFRPNEQGLLDHHTARLELSKLNPIKANKSVLVRAHLVGLLTSIPHEWVINDLAEWLLIRPKARLVFVSDDPLVAEAWEQALAHEVTAIKHARRGSHAKTK